MIAVRSSRSCDGQRAVEIWRHAVDATHGFLLPQDVLQSRRWLPQTPPWLVVDANDYPLAFTLIDGGHVEALFVDPACRGTGIGAALVRYGLSLHPKMTVGVNEIGSRRPKGHHRNHMGLETRVSNQYPTSVI